MRRGFDRRTVVGGIAAAPLLGAAARTPFAALEARSGGRLGVAVLDTMTGAKAGWRIDERFPMMSTAKLPVVAALLSRVDHGRDRLDRQVVVDLAAVAGASPRTQPKVFQTMSLLDLAEAAIVVSDNGAMNLIVGELGGPAAVTDFVRGLDDTATRFDRLEPALSEGLPGDLRDTTTPAMMLGTLRRLLIGNVLRDGSRDQLIGWLAASTTGESRLRAGLPGWRVVDKPGTSDDAGTSNDIAAAWRPGGGAPVLIAVYLQHSPLDRAGRDAILAEVGRIAATI